VNEDGKPKRRQGISRVAEARCLGCGETKPIEEFATKGKLADGTPKRRSRCRKCDWPRVYAAKVEYRKRYPEKIAAPKRQGRKPELQCGQKARRRARRAGVPHEPYSRSDIFARYFGACAYCNSPAEHIDHVNPISKGGADAPHNLLPACAPCNLSKSDRTLAEWAATF
jgi:5-methylcytosine-specific restriction endonuclease McrA